MQDLPRQPPALTDRLPLDITIETQEALINTIGQSLLNMPDDKAFQRTYKLLLFEQNCLKWLIYLKTLLAQLDLNHQIHNN